MLFQQIIINFGYALNFKNASAHCINLIFNKDLLK